jgi:hypothetical protein
MKTCLVLASLFVTAIVTVLASATDTETSTANDAIPLAGACTEARNLTLDLFYCTIQEAFDAATNGHEIVVTPSTYVESSNFLGNAIHRSERR